jgi:hypothetical protein
MSQIRWGITVYENRYLNLSAHMKIYLDWNKQGRRGEKLGAIFTGLIVSKN